jgi:putative ABC transport system ATP-binding protein
MTQTAGTTPLPPDGTSGPLIDLAAVEKVYRTGRLAFPALRGVDLAIQRGEMVSIVGPSGSGKSTLLNIITGIDRPTAGSVTVDGQRIETLSEDKLAAWRGRRVGIVFQFFQLLPTLTALENAVLPMDFAHVLKGKARSEQGRRNLELVGLGDKLDHLPSELSGGEQQRVAIARALACDPALLVCDEPTGNLDSESAERVLNLLLDLNRAEMTIVFVTHDRSLAERASRQISIRDGQIESDRRSS